jgi:hypothetical protein
MRWREGDEIVGRHCFRGRPWHVWAGRVVQDSPELLAVWLPRGAGWLRPVGSLFGEWGHEPTCMPRPELHLTRLGRGHSIHVLWTETGELRGWYVNLETGRRHSRYGFEYEDQLLDVWVEPGGEWRWLDEDELAEAVERGIYDQAQADAIRAEGERVLKEWPFPTGWEDWQPDPSWPTPLLPDEVQVG